MTNADWFKQKITTGPTKEQTKECKKIIAIVRIKYKDMPPEMIGDAELVLVEHEKNLLIVKQRQDRWKHSIMAQLFHDTSVSNIFSAFDDKMMRSAPKKKWYSLWR